MCDIIEKQNKASVIISLTISIILKRNNVCSKCIEKRKSRNSMKICKKKTETIIIQRYIHRNIYHLKA